jgi:hypothetical protein
MQDRPAGQPASQYCKKWVSLLVLPSWLAEWQAAIHTLNAAIARQMQVFWRRSTPFVRSHLAPLVFTCIGNLRLISTCASHF